MKLAGKHITIALSMMLLFLCSFQLSGQSCHPSFDEAFRGMRMNVGENIHFKADDYLQYTPAVVMLGLKAFGYEGRTSWGRMLSSDAFSAVIMAGMVNGFKYSIQRMRPDGTSRNSFPSGHTATSFMIATMLHKEYGWRSPWFSFGAYALASSVGLCRLANDRHWMTDVMAGALIGWASVELGYLITDKIFRDRHINSAYERPSWYLDPLQKQYGLGVYVGYLLPLGRNLLEGPAGTERVCGGGILGVSADIPVVPRFGVTAKAESTAAFAGTAGSWNRYSLSAGGYWNQTFAKVMEGGARILAGYAFANRGDYARQRGICSGLDLYAGADLGVMVGEHFKIKAFAGYEALRLTRQKPFMHCLAAGGSAVFFW